MKHKKNKLFGRICSILLTLLACVGMLGVTAFAADESWSCKLNVSDTAKADEAFKDGTGIDGLKYDKGVLTWDGGELMAGKTDKQQQKAVAAYQEKISDAGLSSDATNKINSMMANTKEGLENEVNMQMLLMIDVFDKTKGDMTGGMAIISPFLPYINIVIGVLAILLVSLLVLSTIIDLACIGLPAVRDAMLSAGDKEGKGDTKKPKAITYAAWATINDVEGGESGKGSGKNAYLTYFKKRLFDYIVLGICLSFLIFGGFAGIMRAFLEIGSSFAG